MFVITNITRWRYIVNKKCEKLSGATLPFCRTESIFRKPARVIPFLVGLKNASRVYQNLIVSIDFLAGNDILKLTNLKNGIKHRRKQNKYEGKNLRILSNLTQGTIH